MSAVARSICGNSSLNFFTIVRTHAKTNGLSAQTVKVHRQNPSKLPSSAGVAECQAVVSRDAAAVILAGFPSLSVGYAEWRLIFGEAHQFSSNES
jgi:hypothetical protein